MKIFNVITIFPEIFSSYIKESLLAKAQKKKLLKINFVNLRDFATDKYKSVDDKPYGGGPGMVLKIEPIAKAIASILNPKSRFYRGSSTESGQIKNSKYKKLKTHIILFSTRGKKFNQETARRLAKYDNLVLICGRYEGVDERVAKYIADEEISVGDYILSGGELPAMVLIEAVSRHIPGVLGKKESLEEIKGSYSVYTRPVEYILKPKTYNLKPKVWKVPKVLISGDHKKIEEWRKNEDK